MKSRKAKSIFDMSLNEVAKLTNNLKRLKKNDPPWMRPEVHDRANRSEWRARQRYGDDAVTKATKAAINRAVSSPATNRSERRRTPSIRRERAAE